MEVKFVLLILLNVFVTSSLSISTLEFSFPSTTIGNKELNLCEIELYDEDLNLIPLFNPIQSSTLIQEVNMPRFPALAIDGNKVSAQRTNGPGCAQTLRVSPTPFWRAEFNSSFLPRAKYVRVFVRMDFYLRSTITSVIGAQVRIDGNLIGEITSGNLRQNPNIFTVDSSVIDTSKSIEIRIPGAGKYLEINEVELYDLDEQRAIIGFTQLSSSVYAGFNDFAWYPSVAIDGVFETDCVVRGGCAGTDLSSNPWWRAVYLPNNTPIKRIVISIRGDCCSDRILGAQVLLDGVIVKTIDDVSQNPIEIVLNDVTREPTSSAPTSSPTIGDFPEASLLEEVIATNPLCFDMGNALVNQQIPLYLNILGDGREGRLLCRKLFFRNRVASRFTHQPRTAFGVAAKLIVIDLRLTLQDNSVVDLGETSRLLEYSPPASIEDTSPFNFICVCDDEEDLSCLKQVFLTREDPLDETIEAPIWKSYNDGEVVQCIDNIAALNRTVVFLLFFDNEDERRRRRQLQGDDPIFGANGPDLTSSPTFSPTLSPSISPTLRPTLSPTPPTMFPTISPTPRMCGCSF